MGNLLVSVHFKAANKNDMSVEIRLSLNFRICIKRLGMLINYYKEVGLVSACRVKNTFFDRTRRSHFTVFVI